MLTVASNSIPALIYEDYQFHAVSAQGRVDRSTDIKYECLNFLSVPILQSDYVLQCVVYDEKFSPRAPIHFLVVPKKRIPYFCDPSGDDEKLLGHLLKVARKVATDKGLRNSFNIIVDEDMKTSKFKCLHIYANCHHNTRPNGLISRL